ncbi:MAG: hypothetical protein AAFR93_17160, partial [Pseudomonadota bacterium]
MSTPTSASYGVFVQSVFAAEDKFYATIKAEVGLDIWLTSTNQTLAPDAFKDTMIGTGHVTPGMVTAAGTYLIEISNAVTAYGEG